MTPDKMRKLSDGDGYAAASRPRRPAGRKNIGPLPNLVAAMKQV